VRLASPRARAPGECAQALECLHEERFVDRAPAEVFASLLEQETYLCSMRTMYWVLADAEEVRERRNQLRHTRYQAPELLAASPNQVRVLGHHEALAARKRDVILLTGHLQPLRRWLDGLRAATGRFGPTTHRRDAPERGDRARPADYPRGPRIVAGVQTRGGLACGAGGDPH